MKSLVRKFLLDGSGNFAMMLAVVAVPLFIAAGMGVDLVQAYNIKSHMQAAADAAAVGSVALSSPGVKAAIQTSSDGEIVDGDQDALNLFRSNLGSLQASYVQNAAAKVVKTGDELTSDVTYSARIPTGLMNIFGLTSLPISGHATASIHTGAFIDFYMLLDNTPSMGIGATPTDVATMVNHTADQCGFACHETDTANDYYSLAKSLGVTMRIDVVRQATQKLLETAKADALLPQQYRMAIYTFGQSAQDTGLDQISALSADYDQAEQDADAIDLMTIPSQNYNNDQQTDFNSVFTTLSGDISNPGDGTSQINPLKYVFFVSDGVNDSYDPANCSEPTNVPNEAGRCQEPINTSLCDALKRRGIRIAVLYTTYLDLPTNDWWLDWIEPFKDKIAPQMEACASPGLFFQVSPTEGISDAMQALFEKILLNPRLTS